MQKPTRRTLMLGALVLTSIAIVVWIFVNQDVDGKKLPKQLTLKDIPFNGQRAYGYLKQICNIGRRISGTVEMQKQQAMLEKHFTKLGGKVSLQKFTSRHPITGKKVEMANIIIQWHPDTKKRIVFCAHYDTRPFPDQDRFRPKGRFLGANDGASGVALLMELAHHMGKLKSNYGIDFVLFDAEELIYIQGNQEFGQYFLGSEYFAKMYRQNPPAYKYRWGVLVDMIGDADLQIFMEKNSVSWNDTYPLVKEIWATAKKLGVKEFYSQTGAEVRDDHLALRNIAGIPTCDIIDFYYPNPKRGNAYWHTRRDVPGNCSALSLAKVGWVLLEWMKTTK